MKHLPAFLLSLVILCTSCATFTGDPLVVTAERTTAIATDTFDSFVKFEYQNRAELAKVSPQIHTFANNIRLHGVMWLQTARAETQAYKQNRSPANKANLQTALAVLQTSINQANTYYAAATHPAP